jgi:transposase
MAAPRKYSQEIRDRAVRLARESDLPLAQIARDLGVHKEALRNWVRQDEADRGDRNDRLSTSRARRAEAVAGGELRAAPRQ